ncbi:MAG: hypothetical protein H8E39_02060, partial [Alphaproteobacteria bacterium]|nr:hypothetical protein [Alphaproteobacteria bacterium]
NLGGTGVTQGDPDAPIAAALAIPPQMIKRKGIGIGKGIAEANMEALIAFIRALLVKRAAFVAQQAIRNVQAPPRVAAVRGALGQGGNGNGGGGGAGGAGAGGAGAGAGAGGAGGAGAGGAGAGAGLGLGVAPRPPVTSVANLYSGTAFPNMVAPPK